LPEQANIEEQTGSKVMSIVFMGETISAHVSYPNVPDIYKPVLDDLYLYGEISRRYDTIVSEGKWTQETLQEFQHAMSGIEKRGYTPYPYSGFKRASCYALADLDNDNSPELLLLEDPSCDSLGKQTPSIYSVFTIRNGKLICIKRDSFDFQDFTILDADGTFYQCIDWRGVGYVDLSAFKLEAGMSEFTIISEARAALSFSDGDVPVPYWIKIVNGEEINIAEKEFEALLEQHKNPGDPMTLNYVPLHPGGATDLYSTPHPSDITPTTSLEYPPVYLEAPSEYKPILDDLYLVSELLLRGESFEILVNYGELSFAERPWGELGYAVIDINNDGIKELLIGTLDGLKDAAPSFLFTLKDGHPVLFANYWSRSRGVIAADGIIHYVGSGGASYNYLSSYRLDKNADTLTELTSMGSDYSQADDKEYFYQEVNGKIHYITEKEFWDFYEKYDSPLKKMELKVIPIANE